MAPSKAATGSQLEMGAGNGGGGWGLAMLAWKGATNRGWEGRLKIVPEIETGNEGREWGQEIEARNEVW